MLFEIDYTQLYFIFLAYFICHKHLFKKIHYDIMMRDACNVVCTYIGLRVDIL